MARSRKGKTKFPKTKKKKRAKTHGFLKRKNSKSGKKVLKARRKKGRHQLTVSKGSSKNAKGNPAK
jgi:large subunit ribosomal protein L34